MRIASVKIENFRTIEDLDTSFEGSYHALSGPNDAGKSNIIRAIRHVIGHADPLDLSEQTPLTFSQDYPKWLSQSSDVRDIYIGVVIEVSSVNDAGVYNFLKTYLKIESTDDSMMVKIELRASKGSKPQSSICIGGETYPDDLAQEAIKRFRDAPSLFFHNSTDFDSGYGMRRYYSGIMSDFSTNDDKIVKDVTGYVTKQFAKLARSHQEQFSQILSRLEPKYRVGLSIPAFEFSRIPYSIVLESSKMDVPLNEWGSGTRNRTLILLAIFNALRFKETENTASRVTPIVVVEEPESFLHPAAQGQFGRLLQDFSEEFGIQIIVTTHSPLMLSQKNPASNLLAERKRVKGGAIRGTVLCDTSGENWMLPFGEALGLESEEFVPWKEALFSSDEDILLVEGPIDKAYFEMLQAPAHGANRLLFEGLIFPYEGKDKIKHETMLKLVQSRFRAAIITFDLDAKQEIEGTLIRLGLKEDIDYFSVGIDQAGKRCIEGLLPVTVTGVVRAANPDLVTALQGTDKERRKANDDLKKLYLAEFQKIAKPTVEHYGQFYPLVRRINATLKKRSLKRGTLGIGAVSTNGHV